MRQDKIVADTKRDDIVKATKALLWQVGYESMSPRMVMDESGAGQGSLYHHFKGKKELAIAALDEIEAEMRSDVDRIFGAGGPPLDRIRSYLSMKRDGMKGCRLGRLATEQSITDDELREPVARYFKHIEAVLSGALKEAIDRGYLKRGVDAAKVATALVATVQGGFLLSRIHGDRAHMRAATEGAAAMLAALEV